MSAADLNITFIELLPIVFLESIPAAKPPPGVMPNFKRPSTLLPAILSTLIIFLFFAISSYAIRVYMRLILLKNWRWDDTLITLGFFCTVFYLSAAISGSVYGVIGVHLWDVHADRVIRLASLYADYIFCISVTPALGFVKLSFLIQFYYLFKPLRWLRLSCWIGGSLIAFLYMGISIASFALASPWPGEDLFADILSWHYFAFTYLTVPTGILGLTTDLFLIVLPIPAVMGLRLALRKKIGVLVVFALGFLAMIGSLMSLYYRTLLYPNAMSNQTLSPYTEGDLGWNAGYITIWTQIELLVGIIAANMPAVHHFFVCKNIIQRIRGGKVSSTIKSLLPSAWHSSTNEKDSTCVQADSSRGAAQLNTDMDSNTSNSID